MPNENQPQNTHRFRFTIIQLLLTMANVAVLLVWFTTAPALVSIASLFFLLVVFDVRSSRPGRLLFSLFGVLIPLELASGFLAYYTVGEIISKFYFLALILNLILLALFVVGLRRTAITLVLCIALILIPYQGYLGIGLWAVQAEAKRIAQFVNQERESTGSYPPNINGYRFRNKLVKNNISYWVQNNDFRVEYRIRMNNSHWYDQSGWHYYPD